MLSINVKKFTVIKIFAIFVVSLFLLSTFYIIPQQNGTAGSVLAASGAVALKSSTLDSGYVHVPYASGSVIANNNIMYSGNVSVMVSFSFQNQSRLNNMLENISNPHSPQYHEYLTVSQFASMFSVNKTVYENALSYFSSFSGIRVKQYEDRISILLQGNSSSVGEALNTSFVRGASDSNIYYAGSSPELPLYIGKYVSEISGLTDSPLNISMNMGFKLFSYHATTGAGNGYIQPITNGAVQYIYGADLQKAYDETGLLNITYPTHEVIATILWSGQNSSGQNVAPFIKSNVCDYFNNTLPSYEPHPHIYGVPLNGAPYPGPSAQYDKTGANEENTLDLEMAGSLAPGASIYNVYSPGSTLSYLLEDFAFILNPNSSASNLKNVSVITNSWGSNAITNSSMRQYLEEAQARGITVLASSGDSGDNPSSSKYVGTVNSFPAMCSFNDFGVTSVGGTTLTLKSNLAIKDQIAWNISSKDTADSGPAGSAGGICTNLTEPVWENTTEANAVIGGRGLGIPDIAAIANNTLVLISINGSSGNYVFWGTSIASPVTAGLVAEMDAVLKYYNGSNVGFLNPLLFKLANMQLYGSYSGKNTGSDDFGAYNSSLPEQVVYNVNTGNNYLYRASYGYNLVTGWGSINDYNFTSLILNRSFAMKSYALGGVKAYMNISALNVTSYLYNSTSGKYTINKFYNASIQQNMFLANSLGAPIYWIQNVIYINGSASTGWMVNYTGWKIYPFYGMYPSCSVYSYNFPAGKVIKFPHDFQITTSLANYTSLLGQQIKFTVNNQTIYLPVPGARYIIGSYNYSYEWNGTEYQNGPYPGNPYNGGLDPQIGLVGGPSTGIGNFSGTTSGTLKFLLEPLGGSNYEKGITKTFNRTIDQTGETSKNIQYEEQSTGNYGIVLNSSSTEQGVLIYEGQGYLVTFKQTSMPSNIPWYVNISSSIQSGPIRGGEFSIYLQNGTYNIQISSQGKLYQAEYNNSITVSGMPLQELVVFLPYLSSVTFAENHLPSGTEWYVNLSDGQNISGNSSTLQLNLLNGTYNYTASSMDKNLKANISGFTVSGSSETIVVDFVPVLFDINFSENGLPAGSIWYVNISNAGNSGPIQSSLFTANLQNGSYNFSVSTENKEYVPEYNKTFTVNGKNLYVGIEFIPYTYKVRFVENNLKAGTEWSLNVTGIKNGNVSKTRCLNLSLTNGTYTYVAYSSGSPSMMANGSFTVNGRNITVQLNFSRSYIVIFKESGLKNNALWYVNISGGIDSGQIGTDSTTFHLKNGSYTYTVASNEKQYHPHYVDSFTVAGRSQNISIVFNITEYGIYFKETGLLKGQEWYISMLSKNVSSNSGTLYWGRLPNGTYTYRVFASSYIYNSSGSVSVNGTNVTVKIVFMEKNSPQYVEIILIILPIIFAVLVALMYVLYRKRR